MTRHRRHRRAMECLAGRVRVSLMTHVTAVTHLTAVTLWGARVGIVTAHGLCQSTIALGHIVNTRRGQAGGEATAQYRLGRRFQISASSVVLRLIDMTRTVDRGARVTPPVKKVSQHEPRRVRSSERERTARTNVHRLLT